MSRENVELVRAAIDAFNRRDWEGTFKDTAPDFEFDFSRAMGPQRGIYHLDQMRGFIDDLGEAWQTLWIEPEEFIEAGEQLVVPWTMHFRGRDGIEVTARTTWVFTIRNGAMVRFTMYQERQEALDAVRQSAESTSGSASKAT